MLYLTPNATKLATCFSNRYLGQIFTPRSWRRPELPLPWAADNDCYSQGEAFDLGVYLAWLERMRPYSRRCLFATLPDVVGDAEATLERSLSVLPELAELDYPRAFVLQDGCNYKLVPWRDIEAVFIGGTTAWKLSQDARYLAHVAKGLGKWVHMGRVNSFERMKVAFMWGCDSVDGTSLVFGPDRRWPEIKRWLSLNDQGRLDLFGAGQLERKPGAVPDAHWSENAVL